MKQQIKLLIGKTTLAGYTKVLSQALIHLNNQPVGPIFLYTKLGTAMETLDVVKIKKIKKPW